MKIMNYLFLMTLLVVSSSCTNYSPFGDNGSEEELADFNLELDFHQVSLTTEDEQLRARLIEIQNEIENGNEENYELLEVIQNRMEVIGETREFNEDLLSRRPIGGGGLPPRCDIRPEFKGCPMPKGALDNFWISQKEVEDCTIQFKDTYGNIVGEMVGVEVVEVTDGQFLKAIFEYDSESAKIAVITKRNTRGVPTSTSYELQ